jgi:hypothetical protein
MTSMLHAIAFYSVLIPLHLCHTLLYDVTQCRMRMPMPPLQ